MLIRQVAFYLGKNGLESWEAKKLCKLCHYFHASVSLFNLSQCCLVPFENSLKVMATGNKPDDFCILIIEGIDAELAHLVLLDYISEHFKILHFAERFNFSLRAGIECHFELLSASNCLQKGRLDKHDLLNKMATRIKTLSDSDTIVSLFLQREEYAATVMGMQTAMPHIMTELVTVPSIILMPLPAPLDWHSPRGPVRCIIAIALPKKASINQIGAFTNLSKKLVDDRICRLLIDAPPELQVAMLAAMLAGEVKG